MKIIGTGLSGLVGSRVVELLSPEYSFENLSLETGVDITDEKSVVSRILQSAAPWVFHFAAFTNVQEAETQVSLGEKGMAWKVNVIATEYIVDACRKSGKRLLYIDTDYAFDGIKKTEYLEDDEPNPLGWYAKTKTEGAKRVLSLEENGVVVRISNPFRANPVGKTDFMHKILMRLMEGKPVVAPSDQEFVPTFIDDFAHTVDVLVRHQASGVFHAVGSEPLSPYDAACHIARIYNLDTSNISKTTFKEYFSNRAPVPQHAILANRKLASLGVVLRSFAEGVVSVRSQEKVASL